MCEGEVKVGTPTPTPSDQASGHMSQNAQAQCPGGPSLCRDRTLPWDFLHTKYNSGETRGRVSEQEHAERGAALSAVVLLGLSRPHHEQSGVSLSHADHTKGAAGLEQ